MDKNTRPHVARWTRLPGLFVLLTLPAQLLDGASILDQFHDVTPSAFGYFVGSEQTEAQMITVGVTGLLTRVDLAISNIDEILSEDDVILDFRPPAGTLDRPTANDALSLGQVTIPKTSIPAVGPTTLSEYLSVDVSFLGLNVTSGQVLGLALVPLTDTRLYWYFSNSPNLYAGGGPSFRNLSSSGPDFTSPEATRDLGFRTWVDPAGSTEIPEPAPVSMVAIGLAGLYLLRRTRSRT